MTASDWEFWIDVGGTFTDCVARRPDGTLMRHKLLSSGATKGAVGAGSSAQEIFDPLRRADPPGFWNGFSFRLLGEAGQVAAESTVALFDPASARLRLATPLERPPRIGQAYELVSGDESPILGMRYLLGLAAGEPIPAVAVRLGTTRGTNAAASRAAALARR